MELGLKYLDVADLDCIFLTYDEPLKEEFWIKLKNLIPWARRIDGVKGSDAAHKAAGLASSTERFILIDGDNLPDENFFNQVFMFENELAESATYRWKSRNHINGLMYGNGGISSWTRTFVANMRTHENTDGRHESLVEFCFEPNYWAMHDCYSTTYPNATPKQAWRAGFREGVKMCLDRGCRPSLTEFRDKVHKRNLDNLTIWHNVGLDVDQGAWAILGSRMGTYKTMLTNWDYREVQDFDALDVIWNEISYYDCREQIAEYDEPLHKQLNLPVSILAPDQSSFFKHHYSTRLKNKGIMVRE